MGHLMETACAVATRDQLSLPKRPPELGQVVKKAELLPFPSLEGLTGFISDIEQIRLASTEDEWARFCEKDLKLAEWRKFLCDDPFTRHGLIKPRGYAGDAVLMDFAYGHSSIRHLIDAATDTGKAIYATTSTTEPSISVRQRIEFVAQQIRNDCETKGSISVASFAAGHGRELEYLKPQCDRLAKIYLIDSDALSINNMVSTHGGSFSLSPIQENVFRIKPQQIGEVDFVYSMGLFDYLKPKAAKRILLKMAQSVKTGGRLLIGNLSDTAANLGYCEAVMDWWMVTRSHHDMAELGATLFDQDGWRAYVTQVGCFQYLIAERL